MELIFIVLAIIVSNCFVNGQDICITSTALFGTCVTIENCENLQKFIKGTVAERELLRQLQCGFDGDIPKVCCTQIPSTTAYVATTASTTKTKVTITTMTTPKATTPTTKPSASTTKSPAITTKRPVTTTKSPATTTKPPVTTAKSPTMTTSVTTIPLTPIRNSCYTLEGTRGTCVDIAKCPEFVKRLIQPVQPKDLEYVQRSRCIGPVRYSVCCDNPLPNNFINNSTAQPLTDNIKRKGRHTQECHPFAHLPGSNSSCCGIDSSNRINIKNDKKSSIRQHPWLAIIEYDEPKKYACGGSLISSLYVLTAAHCVVSAKTKTDNGAKSVRLGEFNTANDGQDCIEVEGNGFECTDGAISITIAGKSVHPEYNKKKIILYSNDIALLKLSELAPYNDFIRPICLPTSDVTQSPPQDLRFTVAGWGAIDEIRNTSDIKLYTDVPFVNFTYCRDLFSVIKGKSLVWEKQICTGAEPNKDSCKGDAGGPLMYLNNGKYEIAGISSYGLLVCSHHDRPSIYTKVYDYLPWIESKIK